MKIFDALMRMIDVQKLRNAITGSNSFYTAEYVVSQSSNGLVNGNIRMINGASVSPGDEILVIKTDTGARYGYTPTKYAYSSRKRKIDGYRVLSVTHVTNPADSEYGHLMMKVFNTDTGELDKIADIDVLNFPAGNPPIDPTTNAAATITTLMSWLMRSYVYVRDPEIPKFEFVASPETLLSLPRYPEGNEFKYIMVYDDKIRYKNCTWPALTVSGPEMSINGQYYVKPLIVKSEDAQAILFMRYAIDLIDFPAWYADIVITLNTDTGAAVSGFLRNQSSGYYSGDFFAGAAILGTGLFFTCVIPVDGGETQILNMYPTDRYGNVVIRLVAVTSAGVWREKVFTAAMPPVPSGYTLYDFRPSGVMNLGLDQFEAYFTTQVVDTTYQQFTAKLYKMVCGGSSASVELVDEFYNQSTVIIDARSEPVLMPQDGYNGALSSMNALGNTVLGAEPRELATIDEFGYPIFKLDGSVVETTGTLPESEMLRFDNRGLGNYSGFSRIFIFNSLDPQEGNFFTFKRMATG